MVGNDIILTLMALSFVPFVAWKSSLARLTVALVVNARSLGGDYTINGRKP